jgi:hypothetical protein
MHCDDKRTKFALKQFILDATDELHDLEKQQKSEADTSKQLEIQNKIRYLEKTIQDSKAQLLTMG